MRFRISCDWYRQGIDELAGAVPLVRFSRTFISLNQDGIVDVRAERILNSVEIGPEAIRSKLHPASNTLLQVLYEIPCILSVALAHPETRYQFGFGVHCHEHVLIANF